MINVKEMYDYAVQNNLKLLSNYFESNVDSDKEIECEFIKNENAFYGKFGNNSK